MLVAIKYRKGKTKKRGRQGGVADKSIRAFIIKFESLDSFWSSFSNFNFNTLWHSKLHKSRKVTHERLPRG